MKFKVTPAEGFQYGNSNTNFAVDGPHLTDDELKVIQDFMEDISAGKSLVGKNKPSWVNDEHEKISGTNGYEIENYWHYHCGPTWLPTTFRGHTVDLKFNPGGKASHECIHYAKKPDNEIVIVGYSRDHIPFILSEDWRNPFFSDDED